MSYKMILILSQSHKTYADGQFVTAPLPPFVWHHDVAVQFTGK
jgi:hypothetical protein